MASKDQIFTPREYQVELLEKALKKNIVVCLGTGSGKTFIAVMLIKEMMAEIKKPYSEGGKRTFFLAKTVPLVAQQASVIRQTTGLKVGHYTGSMNVDAWNKDAWVEEFEKHEVLVMTTQILVNILNLSFMSLSQINLLIFDECHHAVGGDPIIQVMKNFERFPKQDHPKVMGLTASVLNGKCKTTQVMTKIRKLEVALQSVIETPTNTAMAILFSTKPKEIFIEFKTWTSYESLKCGIVAKILIELKKLPEVDDDKEKIDLEANFENDSDSDSGDDIDIITEDDEDEDFKFIIGTTLKLSRLLKDLLFAVKELGLWCANILAKQMLEELKKAEDDVVDENRANFFNVKDFITTLAEQFDGYFKKMCPNSEADAVIRFSSPKLNRLLEIVLQYKPEETEPTPEAIAEANLLQEINKNEPEAETFLPKITGFKAIVFVERRSVAWIINKLFQHLKKLDKKYEFVCSEFVMGHGADPAKLSYAQMKANRQQKKINQFRSGECNLLIATRVVEEGMDIPTCNLVIRFDEPKDFRSYVQSKGRARSRENAFFILLTSEDTSAILKSDVGLFRNIEESLQTICRERMPPTEEEIGTFYKSAIPPYYTRGPEGPSVTMYSAIELVNRYCSLLPKDKFTRLRPRIKFERVYPKVPLLEIDEIGEENLFDDFDVLIQSSATQICPSYRCILWLPVNSTIRHPIVSDVFEKVKLAKKSVAMKVCIELHKAGQLNDELQPMSNDHTEFVRNLIDIEEETVPIGAAQPGTSKRRQLYPKQIAKVFQRNCPGPNQSCYLYKIDLKLSKTNENKNVLPVYDPQYFDEIFGILSKNKIPKIHPFPLHSTYGKIWVEIEEIQSDLTLEDEHLQLLSNFHFKLFTGILDIFPFTMQYSPTMSDFSMLVIPLKNVGLTRDPHYFPNWGLLQDLTTPKDFHLPSSDERKSFIFDREKFDNSVVLPLHTVERDLYFVEEVWDMFNPTSVFAPNNSRPITFVEYYQNKYKVKTENLHQPLLATKLVGKSTNLLQPKVFRTKKKKQMIINGKALPHKICLIPELCGITPLSASLLNQAQCLPSIIYRLNDLLLCEELLKQITQSTTVSKDILKYAPHLEMSKFEKNCRLTAIANEYNWEKDYVQEELGQVYSFAPKLPTSNVILNALTTRAANDCFNLERLEILGDSFLKYATTLYLFSAFPDADEGKLTSARSKLISNSYLYQLAKRRGISNLTKVEIFSPNFQWLPPCFNVMREVEEKLKKAGVPFHAWHYVKGQDVRNLSSADLWALIIEKIVLENEGRNSSDKVIDTNRDDNVYNRALFQQIPDKSISDSVEAILGAYLLQHGFEPALNYLLWLGVPIPKVDDYIVDEDEYEDEDETKPFKLPETAFIGKRRELSDSILAGVCDLQENIGYEFREKSFLVQALTHPSYIKNNATDCYQRLEFLGDALLDYMITWNLFKDERKLTPGALTDARSALVNNVTFARLAVKYSYHQCLNATSPSLFEAIRKFIAMIDQEEANSLLMFGEDECVDEEEVEVPKVLGDVFESIAGAIYLDSRGDLDSVWRVYYKMMKEVIDEYSQNPPKHPVREVYEIFPDIKFSTATPIKKDEDDEDEQPSKFMVVVRIRGKTFRGIGKSGKAAKLNAAKCVLRYFRKHPDKKRQAVGNIDLRAVEEMSLEDLFLSPSDE